jgi:hypothetical protein
LATLLAPSCQTIEQSQPRKSFNRLRQPIPAHGSPPLEQRGEVGAAVYINKYPANAGKTKVAKKYAAVLREELRVRDGTGNVRLLGNVCSWGM